MAKIYGINGKLTGKMGNTVFAVDGGIQVARQYNPIVANPRTPAQVTQRLKVNFAGQMSRGIVPAAIEGLGGNKRQRRSALLSNLIKDAFSEVNSVDGVTVKFMNPELLVLSVGSVKLPDVNMALTATLDGMNVIVPTLTFKGRGEGTVVPKGNRVRVVFIAMSPEGSSSNSVVSQVIDHEFAGAETEGVTGIITMPDKGGEYSVFAYVIPLELANAGMLSPNYVGYVSGFNGYALGINEVTGGAYNYGRSIFVRGVRVN